MPVSTGEPLESLEAALRAEGNTKKAPRVSSFIVLLVVVGSFLVGLQFQPHQSSAQSEEQLSHVVTQLEHGLQTVDPATRTALVEGAFCESSPHSGAQAILAGIPFLPPRLADEDGRLPWVSLTLGETKIDGDTASASLITSYDQAKLPGTKLPDKASSLPVTFRNMHGHWCIV